MNRLKTFACVAALAVFAGGVTACAAGGSDDNTLTVAVIDPVDAELMKKLAADFEKSHKGVAVKVNTIPEDVYTTKLQTSILAKNPPDIAQVYTPGAVAMFQPLDDVVYAENDLNIGDYNGGVLSSTCGWDGKTYCVGGYVGAIALAYNKDKFDAAGEPYPSATVPMTLEEYSALAARLNKGENDWGGDAAAPTWWFDTGTFMDSSGKTSTVTSDVYENAMTELSSMVKDGTAPSPGQTAALGAVNGMLDLFFQGNVAMIMYDPSNDGATTPPINIGLAPTPVVDGAAPWVSTWTNGFGIPKNAKHADLAAEFLALFATEGQTLTVDEGLMPLRTSDVPGYVSGGPVQAALADIAAMARPAVFTPDLWAWGGLIEDAYTSVLRGDENVETALGAAQPKIQQVLDTTWDKFNKDIDAG